MMIYVCKLLCLASQTWHAVEEGRITNHTQKCYFSQTLSHPQWRATPMSAKKRKLNSVHITMLCTPGFLSAAAEIILPLAAALLRELSC